MGRDYKHHQRKRRYARKKRDELLDGHETVNNHLRKRIADLQQRLERAVDANVTLRRENARLRALGHIGLLSVIEDQAFTIHVHEKSLAEYAATVCTMQKRIAELEASQAKPTQLVVDAALRKAGL